MVFQGGKAAGERGQARDLPNTVPAGEGGGVQAGRHRGAGAFQPVSHLQAAGVRPLFPAGRGYRPVHGLRRIFAGERRAGGGSICKAGGDRSSERMHMRYRLLIGGVLLVMMLFGTIGCGKPDDRELGHMVDGPGMM